MSETPTKVPTPPGPMEVPFVDLDRQHRAVRSEIDAAIADVLDRGDFIGGEAVTGFERAFADYIGVSHAIGTNSGTAALSLSLLAVGIGPGDEVLVPAHTYTATALAVSHVGAKPVFCEVGEEDGLVDLDDAATRITARTKAVIVVHLYGATVNPRAARRLASDHDLTLIEDAAQAHGARAGEIRAGSFGDLAAFSFYPSKNLGAFGDGGIVCTDDPDLAAAARRWGNLGQEGKGEHLVPGYNERLDTVQAAILGCKLPHLDVWNESRREAARRYRGRLPEGVRSLPVRTGYEDVHHLYPVRVEDRDGVRARLADRGIGTGIHYSPAVHRQPPYAEAGLSFPVAEAWAASELSLPIFPMISAAEVDAVCAALGEAL